jgi:diadenosine tetraphosphate (Ap4A) HIT family hydrolase
MASCIFCDIVAGQAPASVVCEDQHCLAFMDLHPLTPGHLLVVPKPHAADLEALDPTVGGQMFAVAQRMAAALRRCGLRCAGVNLFLADGAAAGQEIFHVHLHVVPRFAGDGIKVRAAAGRPTRAELDAHAGLIARSLV